MTSKPLEGKVAVVTGSAGTMGLAAVKVLLEDGCAAFNPSVHATSIADLHNIAAIETCGDFVHRLTHPH